MSEFLFEMPKETLSPALAWEKKNRIKTHFAPGLKHPWLACRTIRSAPEYMAENGERWPVGYGKTREEAVCDLCRQHNLHRTK